MKSLKTIIIAFLLLQTAVSFGQTKEETEQWINEKFKKIIAGGSEDAGGGGIHTRYHKTEAFLKQGEISASHITRHYSKYKGEVIRDDTYTIVAKNLPINRLEKIELKEGWKEDHHLIILYFDKYIDYGIQYIKYDKLENVTETMTLDNDYAYKKYSATIYVPNNLEENLAERIKKALEHYATFFPKPEKKKETF